MIIIIIIIIISRIVATQWLYWLFALPITPCGLCLDDEAVRIAVSVRLGMAICVPHNCHCGSLVDAHGLHSFVCRKAPGNITRHHALNDLVARAFTSVGIQSSKEPHGLVRQMANGRTASHWSLGREANLWPGTSRPYVLWLIHMW